MSYAGEQRAREPEVQLRPPERPAQSPRMAPEPRIEPRWQDPTVQTERTKDPQQQQQQQQRQVSERRLAFAEARERMMRERHDAAWWDHRYQRIVRAGTGYYFLDAGWWYPAFGYDLTADVYPYEGPIYAFGDMKPDQEIVAIQQRLQADGYYSGSITGVLDSTTQAAIAKFQAADGLLSTGAIDQPTIEALGLA